MPLRAGRSSAGGAVPAGAGAPAVPKRSGAMVAASTVEPAANAPSTIVAAPSSSQPNERSDACISIGRPARPRRRRARSTSPTPTASPGVTDTPPSCQPGLTCRPKRAKLPSMLEIEPLTATIGAEVGGVDLADEIADAVVDELREALLEWKVLFFRDQHRLDRAPHVALGRRFGELEIHPITPADQKQPEVFVIPAGGKFRAPDNWHSDVTWRPEPSMGSILRTVELPPLGGDTLWADMGTAYDLLDDETKEKIDDRKATHDYASAFGRGQPAEVQDKMRAKHPTVEHPVVRTHPETGRPTLYVNIGFTRSIVGMDDEESKPLLARLYRQAHIVDVQCRFRWRPGSVAFWDNRATQHVVSNDFLPAKRVRERVTVISDVPF